MSLIYIVNKNISTRLKRAAFGCHVDIFQELLKMALSADSVNIDVWKTLKTASVNGRVDFVHC